jgi:uncharacterized protein YcfL
MKKLIVLLLVLLMLVGCGKIKSESDKDERFVTIETSWNYLIVADCETGVMYAVSDGIHNRGTFTLLVDEDGNPLIWDGK